jgi:Zn finger protein HypA/HybF involved in hydrogenase expression
MLCMVSCRRQNSTAKDDATVTSEEDFTIGSLPIKIHCPKCKNEMVHDQNSLALAESPRGAMLECGKCQEISQWEFTGDPIEVKQVPVTRGKKL